MKRKTGAVTSKTLEKVFSDTDFKGSTHFFTDKGKYSCVH